MQGCRAEASQGDPFAVKLGDIPQGAPDHAGAGQIMLLVQKLVKSFALILTDKSNRHAFE
jgi:hypothetical protein